MRYRRIGRLAQKRTEPGCATTACGLPKADAAVLANAADASRSEGTAFARFRDIVMRGYYSSWEQLAIQCILRAPHASSLAEHTDVSPAPCVIIVQPSLPTTR